MNKPAPLRSRSAFTLIELMMVVAILGVLAALAIPAFRTVMARTKTTEAATNLGVMYRAAAAYYATERGAKGQTGAVLTACTVADTVGTRPATPARLKQKMPNDDASFQALGFGVSDLVYFAYGLASLGTSTCGVLPNTSQVYTLYANGDLDGDGTLSSFEMACASDDANTLYHARGIYIERELE